MSNVFSFKNNGVFLGTQMRQDKFRRVLLKFEVVPMINSLPQKRQVLGGLARQISLPCWELRYPTGMEEENHLDPATGNNRNMLVAWRVSPKPAWFGDFGDTSLTIFTIHHHARGDINSGRDEICPGSCPASMNITYHGNRRGPPNAIPHKK